jgi:hypothetical protein
MRHPTVFFEFLYGIDNVAMTRLTAHRVPSEAVTKVLTQLISSRAFIAVAASAA